MVMVIAVLETPLRESITLYGTVGTGFVVPQNLNIFILL